MQPVAIAQLFRSDEKFSQMATKVVGQVRRNLCVPDHAEDDVEAEFVALRQRLDAYYPEFCALVSSALLDQLGPERLQEMLCGLSTPAAQRYLEAAEPIQRELAQSVPALTQKLTAAAQSALASSTSCAALKNAQQSALSLARAAGVERTLLGMAQAVARRVLRAEGEGAGGAQPPAGSEAERIEQLLLGMLATFYARLFIRHVGEPHVAAVVAELGRKPLQDYVFARSATQAAIDRGLCELIVRVLPEVM